MIYEIRAQLRLQIISARKPYQLHTLIRGTGDHSYFLPSFILIPNFSINISNSGIIHLNLSLYNVIPNLQRTDNFKYVRNHLFALYLAHTALSMYTTHPYLCLYCISRLFLYTEIIFFVVLCNVTSIWCKFKEFCSHTWWSL